MSFGMKRSYLQAMAIAKIEDAKILFANKRFSSAYYLAGYSLEFALKAWADSRPKCNTPRFNERGWSVGVS